MRRMESCGYDSHKPSRIRLHREPDMQSDTSVRESVSEYYGQVLSASEDLKTNACCASGAPPTWLRPFLSNVHDDVASRFYGCGFPIPEALDGATAVDLGCGTGRDVFVIAQLVGARGLVHGVDMTEEQLAVARDTEAWHAERFGFAEANTRFHKGLIEDLSGIETGSVDVVVSNCVVNLSPRKDLVFAEVFRVLKPGGEFYFSDVLADRRLPEDIVRDPILFAECLGGAMYNYDLITLAKKTGFGDPRLVESHPITVMNDEIEAKVGLARFTSDTMRLFKLDGLDERCEDYGQIAIYKGTIPYHPHGFRLDDHHVFEAGRPERVCGNTAAMLRDTRYGEHFEVIGDTSVHYGVFPCGETMATQANGSTSVPTATSVAAPASTTSCC